MEKATLTVRGMTCGNCVKHVTKALSKVPGVTEPNVDLGSGKVALNYDPALADLRTIADAVAKAGYPASPE
jgi:copper chaperone CopZ